MENKDIEKYETKKALKSAIKNPNARDKNFSNPTFKKIVAHPIIRKFFVYDNEKISGSQYFIRFLIISIIFVFPSMIFFVYSFFRIILYILFSYLFSVAVYKRCNSIKYFSSIAGAIWGFSVIWFSVLLDYQSIEGIGLITTLPHLILIFKNGSTKP
jgi:hypothetical protein